MPHVVGFAPTCIGCRVASYSGKWHDAHSPAGPAVGFPLSDEQAGTIDAEMEATSIAWRSVSTRRTKGATFKTAPL